MVSHTSYGSTPSFAGQGGPPVAQRAMCAFDRGVRADLWRKFLAAVRLLSLSLPFFPISLLENGLFVVRGYKSHPHGVFSSFFG